MVVGQEIEGLGTAVAAGGYGRLDGADIISKMWRPGGGDSGQDTLFFRHEINSFLAIESSHSGVNRPNETAWRSVARLSGAHSVLLTVLHDGNGLFVLVDGNHDQMAFNGQPLVATSEILDEYLNANSGGGAPHPGDLTLHFNDGALGNGHLEVHLVNGNRDHLAAREARGGQKGNLVHPLERVAPVQGANGVGIVGENLADNARFRSRHSFCKSFHGGNYTPSPIRKAPLLRGVLSFCQGIFRRSAPVRHQELQPLHA